MNTKLTDKLIRALQPPAAGNRITYDSEVPGFGCRITAAGTRSFIFNYRARATGREARITIGSYPSHPVHQAREQAKSLRRRVDNGEDPMAQRHADRAAPTVADMAERYLADHVGKKAARSVKEDLGLNQLILPRLGRLRVQAVRRTDIEAFHRSILKKIRANRALSLLTRMFNLAITWEWIAASPCKSIERNAEDKRDRYLTAGELERLMAELGKRPNQPSANIVRLLLLTGARRGEVLNCRWDQVDLTEGVWTKPASTTKQRKLHRVPLSGPARQLLAEMHAASDGGAFLFPGRDGRAQTDLKNFWAGLCRAAGIKGVRVHDLRHSYASFLVSGGLSLPVIGQLLGHNSVSTTARYSHLFDDPLRAATEKVGAIIDNAGKEGGASVEQLHRKGAA